MNRAPRPAPDSPGSTPSSHLRRIAPAVSICGGLSAFLLFAATAWATFGPGRIWAFDRMALAGSAMLLDHARARIFYWLPTLFGSLAVGAGLLLGLAFLVQWMRTRRCPRELGAAFCLFAGANLATQAIKGLLPAVSGAWGFPFGLPIGFPSGHATLAISLALVLLLLVPVRWRPWVTPGAGAGAALVNYSLFRFGFHAPGEILGAVLLTAALAFPVLGGLPCRREGAVPGETPGGWERLSAWLTVGLGLGGLVSGALALQSLPLPLPGRMEALVAFEAGWRLIVGAPMLVAGLVALLLAEPGRMVRGAVLSTVLPLVLLITAAAHLWLRAGIQARERSPRAGLEDQLYRLARLRRAEYELHGTYARMRWALGGAAKWTFLAELPHRLRTLEQDLRDFAACPMDAAEREAFARLEKDWLAMRSTLTLAAEQIQGRGQPTPGLAASRWGPFKAPTEDSMRALRQLVQRRALLAWEAQGESMEPVVLGRPRKRP